MKPVFILLISVLMTACAPLGLPTPQPTHEINSTAIAIAAQATVTAMAAASPQQTNPAATITPAEPPGIDPTQGSAQPAEFWVVYLSKNKLAVANGSGISSLLTNTPGMDYLPRWSPDGMLLGFIRFDGSSRQDGYLQILPAGSNTPFQVNETNVYNHFAWLPDSQTLLAVSGMTGSYTISLVSTTNGTDTSIAQNVTEIPALSPDGKKILYLQNTGAPCNGKGCAFPNDVRIYDLDTRQAVAITSDEQPKSLLSWSPDGQQIAYLLPDESGNLANIIAADGRPIGARQPIPWWMSGWQRSPDGSLVAYSQIEPGSGAAELYVRPIPDGDQRLVARINPSEEMGYNIDTIRWRPDGSGLVFNTWKTVNTVNTDGSELRQLTFELENVFFDVRPTTGAYAPPVAPTPPSEWNLCPGGMPSRLDVGRRAAVSTDPPAPNNVRSGPDKRSDVIGQIEPGEKIEVTGGPVCDNGQVWWEVISLSTGLKGYTLEGDKQDYWLVPVND